MDTYDYVVIGAGPAGCAVAARLADACPDATVALLEAGPARAPIFSDVPFGLALLVPFRSRYNYGYHTVPQAGLGGRRGYQPRGRGLGGSSLINAMIYTRGHAGDYDDWAAAGCAGWSYADLLPYFRRSEGNARGADAWHGGDGPLKVEDLATPHPFSLDFIAAAEQAGFASNTDFNGATQEGVGLYQVFTEHGRRCNAARAYLSAPRSNLHVVAGCHVERILFDDGRATGVEVSRGGGSERIGARAEAVLCAGAFGSPQLLMCSGIGPASHLREHGIDVVVDRPAVGENLQDHVDYTINLAVPDRSLLSSANFLPRFLGGYSRWRRGEGGACASNVCEAGGFVKTDPSLARPDVQLHFLYGIVDRHNRRPHLDRGISAHVCVLRPTSRGNVRLAHKDAGRAPLIDPRFLDTANDMHALEKGVQLLRRILAAPALARHGGRVLHGSGDETGEALRALIRRRADTIYHPVGTCRMGADADSVVDPELRLRGIENVRVADASIMPKLIGGNTEAPSAVIGEKAADLLASRTSPPRNR
ncbi:MAG TPA: GMC family oxidoreductase N-terminal domain-containing protein [Luteibacter sp.]|nr:GMC family oxidoreductase N-terminal domain-containing protein [Luteibacter sp.]